MKCTTLGRTGLPVSRIAFGTWQPGGDWGPTVQSAAISAIQRAADQGVTLFDTAQAYGFGASEPHQVAYVRQVPPPADKLPRGRRRMTADEGGVRPVLA